MNTVSHSEAHCVSRWWLKRTLSALAVLLGVLTLHAQTTKPAPPTPIDKKKAELGGTPWNPDWDRLVEQAVPKELLSSQVPRDVRRFCPRFYDMSETGVLTKAAPHRGPHCQLWRFS